MRTRFKSFLKATLVVDVIPLRCIIPSGINPREKIVNLDGLVESIKRNGVLEPIIVRPNKSKFEIVAGHRRFLASKMARLQEVPAMILDLSDKEAFEISLMENLQRESLDPIEEAMAFRRYVKNFGYGSTSELARIIGKSEEYVSHRIMLLKLDSEVQEQVRRRLLTPSDAWELSRVDGFDDQRNLAACTVEKSLTVKELREAANLVKAGLPVEKALQRVEDEDSRRWIPSTGSSAPLKKSLKVKKAATSILRVSLVRIDDLISNLDGNESELKEELLAMRYSLHRLIDCHMSNEDIDANTRHEIETFLKSQYLQCFNSQNADGLSNLRVSNFTLYDDFPPLTLMDYKESKVHDRKVFETMSESRSEMRDLAITRLGSVDFVLVTFSMLYNLKLEGRMYVKKSRATHILERTADKWRIIHEHWSNASNYEFLSEEDEKIPTIRA